MDYQYDVFISYSSKDRLWVKNTLVKRLEDDKGFRICIDYRDFVPGLPIIKNIQHAVIKSRKVLPVMTPHYLDSDWTLFEALLSQTDNPANSGLRLIPILKEKCQLPPEYKFLTHVNFADPEDEDLEWERLLSVIAGQMEEVGKIASTFGQTCKNEIKHQQRSNEPRDVKNLPDNPRLIIRECLCESFTDRDDLMSFCYDYFGENLLIELGKEDKFNTIVTQIMKYCDTNDCLNRLWDGIKSQRPTKHEKYYSMWERANENR